MTSPLLLVLAVFLAAPARAQHPLEPLSAAETVRAVAIAREAKGLPEGTFFPQVALKEPPKSEVLAWRAGKKASRRAGLVVYDRAANKMSEAVVDLAGGKLASWTERPGAQPNVMLAEFEKLPAAVKADARWRAAMKSADSTPRSCGSTCGPPAR
ncbi:MAG: hypothetical protein M0D55_17415 [Elusimicrobiota bacterium]|nr:MAG: hypothetical protein M0D55_17415 [Elusimicrobiota bacterium]